jgi:hypothetical protein
MYVCVGMYICAHKLFYAHTQRYRRSPNRHTYFQFSVLALYVIGMTAAGKCHRVRYDSYNCSLSESF